MAATTLTNVVALAEYSWPVNSTYLSTLKHGSEPVHTEGLLSTLLYAILYKDLGTCRSIYRGGGLS